ncbi:hypothetical protein HQ544_03005 [Candidatus Falkowbacteria bacterium]|nr:hypothetical protein [Candidatus Falkowbacteria bacterium]
MIMIITKITAVLGLGFGGILLALALVCQPVNPTGYATAVILLAIGGIALLWAHIRHTQTKEA